MAVEELLTESSFTSSHYLQRRERFGGLRHSLKGQQMDGHCRRIEIVHVI